MQLPKAVFSSDIYSSGSSRGLSGNNDSNIICEPYCADALVCGLKMGLSHSEPEFVAHSSIRLQEPLKPPQQEREGKARPNSDNGAKAYESAS